jgi:hypothetical protein
VCTVENLFIVFFPFFFSFNFDLVFHSCIANKRKGISTMGEKEKTHLYNHFPSFVLADNQSVTKERKKKKTPQ